MPGRNDRVIGLCHLRPRLLGVRRARGLPMACPLLEQPSEIMLLIAAAATSRSVGRLAQVNSTCRDVLRTNVSTRRIPHDARMAHKSAFRHAMLVSGPCPFQKIHDRAARCCGFVSHGEICGARIRATAEEDAPPRGMALLIKMLHHVRLEHTAEYGQLLSLFNQHAARES